MLALRCLICNDRWDEGWAATVQYRQKQRQLARHQRIQKKLDSLPAPQSQPTVTPIPVQPQQTAPKPVEPKQPYRPPANHPWRRPFLNKAAFN